MMKASGKARGIVSIAAAIFLALGFSPRIAFSEALGGGDGDPAGMSCVPPEDMSPCETGIPALSGPARTILQIYYECAKTTKDPDLQNKFAVLAVVMATGPQAFAIAGPYAVEQGTEEFLQCAWKGWIEAGDGTREEKELRKEMVKKIFDTKDYATIPRDLFRGDFLNKESLEGAAQAFGVVADVDERIRESEKFDFLFRSTSEAYFGIPELVRNNLRDIETSIGECRFDLPRIKAAEAERLMESYCVSKGATYRKLEKEVRCYREKYSRILELQSGGGGGGGPQYDQVSGMQAKLKVFRDGMVRDLRLIDDVKRIKERIEERYGFFNESRAGYLNYCSETEGFLAQEDLKQACASLDKVMAIEGMQSRECLLLMSDGNRQCRGGELLEIDLNQASLRMEGAVDQLFEQAESRINACQLEDARKDLDTALRKSPSIWSRTGDGCQPWRLASTVAARRDRLLKRIEDIEADGKKANDLMISAKTMAGDSCRYEDALSGELSDTRIWTLAVNGCIPDLTIQGAVEEIQKEQKASADKAESLEKSVLEQVEKAKARYSTDEVPLYCAQDESGLDEVLALAAPLLCEGVSPLPVGVQQRAERVTSGIRTARQFIGDSVAKRTEKASGVIDKALSDAEVSLDACDPGKAKGRLELLEKEVDANCLTEEQSGRKSSLAEKARELEKDLQERVQKIEALRGDAEKSLKSCEWTALNDQIAVARQSLPRGECYATYPEFDVLKGKLDGLESREKSRAGQVEAYSKREYDLLMIKTSRALLDDWDRDKRWDAPRRDNFNRNFEPLKKLLGEITAAGLRECMPGIVSQTEDLLARAEKLPGKADDADDGFGAAGEGRTEQATAGTPTEENPDRGFASAGPGETSSGGRIEPAAGFGSPWSAAVTTPLGSPDPGGFSGAGPGATRPADPTAGRDGRSGNRDARPQAATAATPPAVSAPIIVRPQPFRGDGQPAASHIFGATSRMGWAAGLAQYSVGPADQSIVEHLMTAGEHVMWANKMSYPPTPAWPGWSQKRSWLQSQANELARSRTNDYRRRIAGSMSGNYGAMCSELSVQTFGTTRKAPNCDASYCRLGFLMARGQQALLVADEANNNGDRQTADKARADGLSHLGQAAQVLSDYERVIAVSGRCADLRDVKQMLLNILKGGNIPDQARAATAAWTTAAERIRNLASQGPPQPGKYEDCLKKYCPMCTQSVSLLGASADPQCDPCKRRNEKLINECVAGTPSPAGRPAPPTPAAPQTPPQPGPTPRTGGGAPGEQGTFSGGLDPAVVQPKLDDRRKRGYTASFKSGPVTLAISPDGRAAITRNVVFEGFLKTARGDVSTYRSTFTLHDGNGRNGSYSGKMTWFSEDYHSSRGPQWKKYPPAEGTWRASRQGDGSYHLYLPNGIAGVYGDIPYRIR